MIENVTHKNISPSWRDFLGLCKIRVVALMLLTVVVAMLLVQPSPPWHALLFGTIGIGLTAACGGVVNQFLDRRLDATMARTKNRPLPQQRVTSKQSAVFAIILGVTGLGILLWQTNWLAAVLSVLALVGYAFIYTLYLKRATPQNIVIGGLAGAMPPLLGTAAVTGRIDAIGICLVLIIFVWTPPHFWALAIHRKHEYAKTDLPMLPITHGVAYTKLQIVLYTILMIATTYLPFAFYHVGSIYFCTVSIINLRFLYLALRLYYSEGINHWARDTFKFSIIYLMLLFVFLLLDHYLLMLVR